MRPLAEVVWRALGRRKGPGDALLPQGQLTRTLELVVDREQLQGAVMGHLIDLYGARRALLLVWNEETGRLAEVWRGGYRESENISFSGEGRLARWLQVNEAALRPGQQREVMEYLAPEERDRLMGLGVELCLPLLAMNRLVALVLLGEMESADREVPGPLLTQMGLALQNAALYAQQQQRLRRLWRAERLATTGELAASAAHEIRNPLTAISSAVQLLGEAFPPDNPRRELAERVMREIDRINQIVEGLLAFARPAEPKREAVHLRQVLEEAVRLVEAMARKSKVEMRTAWEVEQDVVEGDRDQLVQLFVNLLLNGVQAMPEGGALEVRLERGKRLCALVRDTGLGMSADQVERAFDPFYTTKEKGTGLGLAICYGIVKSHGGEIDLESRPGEGTSVRVEL